MLPPGPLFHKPKSILAARNILYASIFLLILNSLISEFSTGLQNHTSLRGIGISIGTAILLFIITRYIGLGHKWARAALLVFFIFEIAAFLFYISPVFQLSLLVGFLFVFQCLLHLLSLIFLFNSSSNSWFNRFPTEKQKQTIRQ
jgi:predicted membrane channel-forming protein YqfA (hemolysin III family)